MSESMLDLENEILKQAKLLNSTEESNDLSELLEESSQLEKDVDAGSVKDRKTVKCKVCQEVGTWTSKGKFPNGTKKWHDHNGLIANGRICGSCNQTRAKVTMRRIRSSEEDFYKEE